MPFGGVNVKRMGGDVSRLPEDVSGRAVLVGVTSEGSAAGDKWFVSRDSNVRSLLGRGSLADLVLDHYAELNARKLAIAVKAVGDVAGANGSLTKTVAGGDGTAALSGTPVEDFELVAEITTAGERNSAYAKISVDGGDSFYPPVLIPSNGQVVIAETGVTITFTNGTPVSFQVGDQWTAVSAGPRASAANILAALNAAGLKDYDFEYVVVAGPTVAADWASFETWAMDREAIGRPCFFLCELAGRASGTSMDTWVAAKVTAVSSFASPYIVACAGDLEVSTEGRTETRSPLGLASSRIQAEPVQRQLSRVLSGKVAGLVRADSAFTNAHAEVLHDAGIVCVRRHNGLKALYWSHGRTLDESSSAFRDLPTMRAMHKVIRLAMFAATLSFGDDSSPLDGDGAGLGFLVGNVQNAIVNGMVKKTPAELVAVKSEIAETVNLAADGKAVVIVKAQFVNHIEDIELQIGPTNSLVA